MITTLPFLRKRFGALSFPSRGRHNLLVHLVDAPVTALTPAGSIHIEPRMEGNGQRMPEGISIRFEPGELEGRQPNVRMQAAPPDANGAFWLRNVIPGQYRLSVEALPDNAYIQE